MSGSRLWMYDRISENRGGLKPGFLRGVEEFVEVACEMPSFRAEGRVRCPCAKCRCRKFLVIDEVKVHLYKWGFKAEYWVWTEHGESECLEIPGELGSAHADTNYDGVDMTWEDNLGRFEDMIYQGFGAGNEENPESIVEEPNEEAKGFYALLEAANKPAWEGCVHSELSLAVRMLSIKSDGHQSHSSFDAWAGLLRELNPQSTSIPKDFYHAKKLVSKLGLGSVKIDCCVDGCMLFYKEDSALTQCKFCAKPRYKPSRGGSRRRREVPHKRLHYLPLIPRLKRLYASMSTAPHMRWHYENQRVDGVMTHPCHGEAWRHFDQTYADFASEPRNVRLGLCTDGFTPNTQFSKPYSCWPVVVTPYNLPPEMCMKDPYLFLTCIIPGPNNPKAKIDVYLQPLIDELQELWSPGVMTYDISTKQNFPLRAALMWTINDFPAYGMLSGWMTQGRLACPICMEDTDAFYLPVGGKNSWFDCHRRFLDPDHEYRNNRYGFRKNTLSHNPAPRRLTSEEVWDRVQHLPKITEVGKPIPIPGYGREHNWTKQSILWELPYWKHHLVRHCLDVMHIEKNVFDNILNIVMDTDRSKDNPKAREDMKEICRRPELNLIPCDNGKYKKPKAVYAFTKTQKQEVCRWVRDLRLPESYASNLGRCVNVAEGKFVGMKSHDCHVFMQCLLPIAFRQLPDQVWKPLTELSEFFSDLCSTSLNVDDLLLMEKNIPIVLCKLERIFPPGWFCSMEHLPVHLAHEARLCGPVQYRWMYPFERALGGYKRTVKNRARVEGSICQAYLERETSNFCSHYFQPHVLCRRTRVGRNDDGGESSSLHTLSVFNLPGRVTGHWEKRWLSGQEWNSAHLHVLINCDEVQPYLRYYEELHGENNLEQFPTWFRTYVHDGANGVTCPFLTDLAWGPSNQAKSWNIYIVNGFKFHTEEWARNQQTYNCGVSVRGDAGSGETDWFGVIKEILEFEYVGAGEKRVVLFLCDWFDPRRPQGTRTYRGYKITEVNHTKRYSRYDPFIIAQNVKQIYYLSYPAQCKPQWWVVRRMKPRGRVEVTVQAAQEEETEEAFQIDGPTQVSVVGETDVPASLRSPTGDMDEVDHPTRTFVQRNSETEDNEDESEEGDEVGHGDDEDEPLSSE